MRKRKLQKPKKKLSPTRTAPRTAQEKLLDNYQDNFSLKSSYDLSNPNDRILFIAALCLDNIAWNENINFKIIDRNEFTKIIAAKMIYLKAHYANDTVMNTKLFNIQNRYTEVCRGAILAKKTIRAAEQFKAKGAINKKLDPLSRITDWKDKARAKSIVMKIRELIPCYQE